MKTSSLNKIKKRLEGIDNNIPRFLKEFYQSAIVSEITTEGLKKYNSIKTELKSIEIYNQEDKEFMKDMENLIGIWEINNQGIYYEIIHERAKYFKRPIENSRDYYAYIMQFIKKDGSK